MKSIIRLSALFIAIILCLTLVACGNSDDKKKKETKEKETETKIEDTTEGFEDEPDVTDETGENEKTPDETEKENTEPVDYDFSVYAGTWVYDNEFITVDEDGNWNYTIGSEEDISGKLSFENGRVITYVDGINKALSVTVTDGKLVIESFATFSPLGQTGNTEQTDMSKFAGEWYLDGDINARFYYRVNADGSWTQYEKNAESSTQIDSGRTETNDEENIFTLITEYGQTIIAEYDKTEDVMYINGDKYVHM